MTSILISTAYCSFPTTCTIAQQQLCVLRSTLCEAASITFASFCGATPRRVTQTLITLFILGTSKIESRIVVVNENEINVKSF